ncbi:MAG: hypothetical protein J0H07_30245 [Sphingobacteriales bacterium]|nr:hypothetical protein [Sphingobacteriales bacterium]
MSTYTMRVHRKTPTDRNPCVAVVIYYAGDGAWFRVFRHRGIHPICEAERPMTPNEIEITEKSWRLLYIKYDTWEGLITDEYLVTGNLEWCREIHTKSELGTPLEKILPEEAFKKTIAGDSPEKEE